MPLAYMEIEPALLPIKLVREGRFLVAIPESDVPPLTKETVESTRNAIYQDRDSQVDGLVELPGRQ